MLRDTSHKKPHIVCSRVYEIFRVDKSMQTEIVTYCWAEVYGEWLLMGSFWSDKNVPKLSCVDGHITANILKFTELYSYTHTQWDTILTRLAYFRSLLINTAKIGGYGAVGPPIHC